MKKKFTIKREVLKNLTRKDLKGVVGGYATGWCANTTQCQVKDSRCNESA